MKRILLFSLPLIAGFALAQPNPAPQPVPFQLQPGTPLATPPVAAPAATPAKAPAAAPVVKAAPGTFPVISCDQPTFEFGSRDNSEKVDHTFVIKNTGTGVLNIGKVKPACGCTLADIKKKVLMPGETTEIKASLSLKGRRGLQTKTITVNSDDPKTPAYRLTMKGTAVSTLGLSPASVYTGNIGEGDAVTKTITLTNNAEAPMKILDVKTQNNKVEVKLNEQEPGKKWTLDVTTSPSLPIGRISDFITITTDNPKAKSERISVYGSVVGKLNVSPSKLDITATPGIPKTFTFSVRPGSVKNYQITAAFWPAANGAQGKIVNRGAQGFSVEFRRVDPTVALNGSSIIMNTNLPDYPIIEVPVTVK